MKATSAFVWLALLASAAIPALADSSTTFYVRSSVGQPWGQSTNEDAMDNVFGSGQWTSLNYEDLDPVQLLSSSSKFIFLEGGDTCFAAFQTFMAAHGDPKRQSDGSFLGDGMIKAWISQGGRLLIMSAPNDPLVGESVSLPDNILLQSDSFFGSAANSAWAWDPTFPVFNSPIPIATNFTGDFFSHGYFIGANVYTIMQTVLNETSETVLGLDTIQSGLMVFGAMTTDNFQLPQPDAHTLLENVISYTAKVALN
jgi:hypothetical protein